MRGWKGRGGEVAAVALVVVFVLTGLSLVHGILAASTVAAATTADCRWLSCCKAVKYWRVRCENILGREKGLANNVVNGARRRSQRCASFRGLGSSWGGC